MSGYLKKKLNIFIHELRHQNIVTYEHVSWPDFNQSIQLEYESVNMKKT